MTYIEDVNIQWQDTGNIDAFGRARVSQLTTQFDAKQLHDKLPLFIDEETNGTATATHSTQEARTQLTTVASGDWVVMQTKQRFNYQSGKSQLLFMTFNSFDIQSDVTKRIGYFSSSTTSPYTASQDGLWLESDGTDISVNVSQEGTNVQVTQSNFNLDVLDGTGKSGVTVDWDDNCILVIDFEWLGVGRVRWGLVINGLIVYFHESLHANNSLQGVYMSSPNQPLRWELRQGGATSGTFNYICATVASEGAVNQIGRDGGIGDDGTHLDANNTSNWYYAIGIRLQAAKVDTLVDVLNSYLKSDTNDDFEWRVCFNPTYASTVTYTDVTNSAVSYGLGVTANTVSAFGFIMTAGFGVQASLTELSLETAIRLGSNLDGTLDEIVLIVKPHTSNLDIHRAINWRELS